MQFYYKILCRKPADRKPNIEDPDQTAPSVWSLSTLFAQTCLSKYLESLWQQRWEYENTFKKNGFKGSCSVLTSDRVVSQMLIMAFE